jgi:hypothetical protein
MIVSSLHNIEPIQIQMSMHRHTNAYTFICIAHTYDIHGTYLFIEHPNKY